MNKELNNCMNIMMSGVIAFSFVLVVLKSISIDIYGVMVLPKSWMLVSLGTAAALGYMTFRILTKMDQNNFVYLIGAISMFSLFAALAIDTPLYRMCVAIVFSVMYLGIITANVLFWVSDYKKSVQESVDKRIQDVIKNAQNRISNQKN